MLDLHYQHRQMSRFRGGALGNEIDLYQFRPDLTPRLQRARLPGSMGNH